MSLTQRIIRRAIGPELEARAAALPLGEAPEGYDSFGAHPDGVRAAFLLTRFLYERYFRVLSTGVEQVPKEGPTILAANHSGTLPFDGMMICADLLRRLDPPRLPRAIADRFVPELPFVSTFFARAGVVSGTRRNTEHLLERGELVLIFPEGTPGIGKPFSERYRLAPFREGHAELAIRHRAAIVPTAVIGAEEQMPQLFRIRGIRAFGAPYLPVPLVPFPLPVRYHIRYGAPIRLSERFPPELSNDPEVTQAAAAEVRAAVQALVDRGLEEREGVFL